MTALVPAEPASHVTGMDTQQAETVAVGTPGDREGGRLGIFDYLDAKYTKLKFA
jgi:hypothetical protein